MKTKKLIIVRPFVSPGTISIPVGTSCVPASNLPDHETKELYWCEPWEGMSDFAENTMESIGILLTRNEIENGLE
jgi:hypothetical protein